MSDEFEQTLTSIQHYAISEVLHLLDGFYENLEHGLFELAFHRNDQIVQGRCAAAMKDLRLQKGKMIRKFTKLMEDDRSLWVTPSQTVGERDELLPTARTLALKHGNHFQAVLTSMMQCIAHVTGRDAADIELPVGPERLTHHFLRCVGDVPGDPELSAMVNDLFARLVLGRLGPLYGQINLRLHRCAEGGGRRQSRSA